MVLLGLQVQVLIRDSDVARAPTGAYRQILIGRRATYDFAGLARSL